MGIVARTFQSFEIHQMVEQLRRKAPEDDPVLDEAADMLESLQHRLENLRQESEQ